MLGMLYTNRAKPLIQVGEFGRATDSLVEAERYATQTEDSGTLSEIELDRAWIARLQSDYSAAASHLDRALAHADTPQLDRERALALEGFAQLREAEGRIEEARSVLQQVIDSFRELGAARDASRAEALLESWSSPDDQDSQSAPHPDERSEI
jgi:tetratricopeptide (TPR) repeat protein